MTALPLPAIPWQTTGNHWLALPCVHPADGSLHALGVLHRGARSAIEFAGSERFLDGGGPALARPVIEVDGVRTELAAEGLAWERALNWLPTFTCTMGDLVIRGTLFAPHGRDADMAGAVYAISVDNRGSAERAVALSLEGVLGHRQQRVRTPRAFEDAHRAVRVSETVAVLEGAARPGLVAVAVSADGEPRVQVRDGDAPGYTVRRELRVPPGGREHAAFYIAAGPERDGAEATVAAMRRRGWRELLTITRDALQALEQTTGHEGVDRLVNRNLLFAYFYGVGRALDDAHFYYVRSRSPANGRGVTTHEWDALAWTLPAVQLADSALARELLLRACELHGYAPGRGVNYLDGTLFEPGFTLEGAAAYAVATDRYIRDSGDDQIVEEPVVADTLYMAHDDVAARRAKRAPLYSTEVTLSGDAAPYPYALHGNAVVAQALEIFRRTLDEESAKSVEDPEAVRAAIKRHFAVAVGGKQQFASAVDLDGHWTTEDDPLASALWLPLYETVDRADSTYRRTARAIAVTPYVLAQQCARLLGPDAAEVLEWLRRAPLDNGVAAELVDADGRAVANGGDAALAGLLAYSAWYAVHALGVQP